MGGHVVDDVISDLSFPRVPGVQMMRRGGPVCETCLLPADQHVTPEAQDGFTPLTGIAGVHPSVDDGRARNAADELPGGRLDPRLSEFGIGRNG